MLGVIARGFANLTRFGGRDTRSQFWPFAAAAVALYLVVGWAALTPIILPVFGPSQLSIQTYQTFVGHFLLVSLLAFGFLVALLAGAVARRLHDSGRSALWGVLPLPFAAYSGTMFFRMASQFGNGSTVEMRHFLSAFVSNGLYLLGLGTLVVLLSVRSTRAPNRYG